MIKLGIKSIALVPAIVLPLYGCGVDAIGDSFSGGASMRIQVEVYKGPLSKEPESQWGALAGLVREASQSLRNLNDGVLVSAAKEGYIQTIPDLRESMKVGRGAVDAGGEALLALIDTLHYSSNNNINLFNLCKSSKSIIDASEAINNVVKNKSYRIAFASAGIPVAKEIYKIAVDWSEQKDKWEKIKPYCDGKSKEVLNFTISTIKTSKGIIEGLQVRAHEAFGNISKGWSVEQLAIQPHYAKGKKKVSKSAHTRTVSYINGLPADDDGLSAAGGLWWCQDSSLNFSIGMPDDYIGCIVLANIHDDLTEMIERIDSIEICEGNIDCKGMYPGKVVTIEEIDGRLKGLLTQISAAASQLKGKALYWAETHVSLSPSSRIIRFNVANFANLAAEYSNQLGSRADTLLQQCAAINSDNSCDRLARGKLPLSVYLREANPTEFLNLYAYNRAASLTNVAEMLTRPLWNLGTEETTDRIRVIERLFADHNWSKINQVYASGQGDVRMAFIKDEIGNWNLKSFSNEPGKLLESYMALTTAAVNATLSMTTGSGGAKKALELASRLARGSVSPQSPQAGGIDIAALSKNFSGQLDQIEAIREPEEDVAGEDLKDEADKKEKKKNVRIKAAKDVRQMLLSYYNTLGVLETSVMDAAVK